MSEEGATMDDAKNAPGPHVADAFGGSFHDLGPAQPVEKPDSTFPPSHGVRSSYDREIAEVKDNVLRMGSLVEDQIRAAINALVAHDAEAALGHPTTATSTRSSARRRR
jgi:hypothetical protein